MALTPEAIDYSFSGPYNSGFYVNSNLYLRSSDGALKLISGSSSQIPVAQQEAYLPTLAGTSADYSHVVFVSNAALTPGAAPPEVAPTNLYDFTGGAIHNVGILPDGSVAPVGATLAGKRQSSGSAFTEPGPRTVSTDGSRIFFSAAPTPTTPPQLYLRENNGTAEARTVEVSASQRRVPDPEGRKEAEYITSSPDGSKVLFQDTEKLTEDATAGAGGPNAFDLYLYDVNTGSLTDLTADPAEPQAAGVQKALAVSRDLSVIYFEAKGAFAPGATSGDFNLYQWSNAGTRFIAATDERITPNLTNAATSVDGGDAGVYQHKTVDRLQFG